MKDNNFAQLSTENKNILLWAGLFHDIKKWGTPLISTNRDPLHPFRSATTFLSIANRLVLCVINDTNTTDFKKGLKIIDDAVVEIEESVEKDGVKSSVVTMQQDHTKMYEGYKIIERILEGQDFAFLVFKLILLH